ncbi:MAG: hypothetical protein U5Q03_19735 [Bacteroidota bacterium]|nr:hypothetical protein [Bacteroidota bacterium]
MTVYRIIIFLLIMILLQACEGVFDYSPYAIDFSEEQTNLNAKNIERLQQKTNHDDTVTIALNGRYAS